MCGAGLSAAANSSYMRDPDILLKRLGVNFGRNIRQQFLASIPTRQSGVTFADISCRSGG